MKRICLFCIVLIFLVFSCETGPEPVVSAPPEAVVQPSEPAQSTTPAASPEHPLPPIETKAEEKVFDPSSITEEKLAATKADVRALISELNSIIKARNYNAWRSHLADSYFEEISSEAFLADTTEELYKRDQIVATNLGRDPKRVSKKTLKNPRDYFDNVVVPSRSNDRMDDLDYVTETRVKAYTIDSRGNWLVLYDLELINDKWMIIN